MNDKVRSIDEILNRFSDEENRARNGACNWNIDYRVVCKSDLHRAVIDEVDDLSVYDNFMVNVNVLKTKLSRLFGQEQGE